MNLNKHKIFNIILSTLAIAGTIVVAVVAPNLFSAFGGKLKFLKKQQNSKIQYSINSLVKRGWVTKATNKTSIRYEITRQGRKELIDSQVISGIKSLSWDKNWRLVIFDVPNKKSRRRKEFVEVLKEMGFRFLQKSVWVIPFHCQEEVDYFSDKLKVEKFVRYIKACEITGEKELLKLFEL